MRCFAEQMGQIFIKTVLVFAIANNDSRIRRIVPEFAMIAKKLENEFGFTGSRSAREEEGRVLVKYQRGASISSFRKDVTLVIGMFFNFDYKKRSAPQNRKQQDLKQN